MLWRSAGGWICIAYMIYQDVLVMKKMKYAGHLE